MRYARLRVLPLACLLLAAAMAGAQGDVSALVQQGRQLKSQKKLDQAAAVLRQAIEQDEENVDAHHLLGWVLQAQGDKEGAAAEFEQVVELDPDSDAAKQDQEALDRLQATGAGGRPSVSMNSPKRSGGFLMPLIFAAGALVVVVMAYAFVKRDRSRSAGGSAVDLGGFEIPVAAAAVTATAQPLDLTQFEAPATPVTDLGAFETPPVQPPPQLDLGAFETPAEPEPPVEAEVELGSFETPAAPEAEVQLGAFETPAEPEAPAAEAEVDLGAFEAPAEPADEDPLAPAGLSGDDDADDRPPIELLDDGDDEPFDFGSLDSGDDTPASGDEPA